MASLSDNSTKKPRALSAARFVEFIVEHPRVELTEVTTHTDVFRKWEAEDKHFTIYEADRRANALGFHPSEIWGWDEWIEAAMDDDSK